MARLQKFMVCLLAILILAVFIGRSQAGDVKYKIVYRAQIENVEAVENGEKSVKQVIKGYQAKFLVKHNRVLADTVYIIPDAYQNHWRVKDTAGKYTSYLIDGSVRQLPTGWSKWETVYCYGSEGKHARKAKEHTYTYFSESSPWLRIEIQSEQLKQLQPK